MSKLACKPLYFLAMLEPRGVAIKRDDRCRQVRSCSSDSPWFTYARQFYGMEAQGSEKQGLSLSDIISISFVASGVLLIVIGIIRLTVLYDIQWAVQNLVIGGSALGAISIFNLVRFYRSEGMVK